MRKYRITTPEQVTFHYEVAGLATRAMAWVLDQLLLLALRVVVFLALAWAGQLGLAAALLGIFVLDFGYYAYFELAWAGQSPGKRALQVRVISARGGRLAPADVLIRNLLRPIDTLPLGMAVGGAVALLDPWHRRLGDLAGETLVIRDAQVRLPEGLLAQQARVNTFQTDPVLRHRILTRATREERDLLLDLLLRRDDLEPGAREDVFRQAAAHFRARYVLPEDLAYLSDEQTVLNLALVLQSVKITG